MNKLLFVLSVMSFSSVGYSKEITLNCLDAIEKVYFAGQATGRAEEKFQTISRQKMMSEDKSNAEELEQAWNSSVEDKRTAMFDAQDALKAAFNMCETREN